MKTERLFIADIEVADRSRSLDTGKLAAIKASIADIGLRTPITVTAKVNDDDWAYRLVAGGHRLEALRQLSEEFVEAFVMEGGAEDAELWEIDENFARAELTDAQRAGAHARREELLIIKGTVHAGKGRPDKSANLAVYSDQAAASLGISKRTVERDLSRGKKIDPAVLAEVEGTALDKGVVLDDLARTPRAQQIERLAQIRLDRSRVSPAADPLNDLEATEKQLAALMAAWNRAGAEARQRFMDRVDTPVFDRGAA